MGCSPIEQLVQAVPGLGNFSVAQVPPIAARLQEIKPSYQLQELTPLSLVVKDPELGRISFANFNAESFQIKDIPGLTQAPLSAFTDWQKAKISDVPGLSAMNWQSLIPPVENGALIGIIKLPSPDEPATSSISGSDIDGYQVACRQSPCPAIEFDKNTVLQNKKWPLGSAQQVRGGSGQLAAEKIGLEPTGRNIYGAAFKVVLTQITPQSVKTSLYFRHCENLSVLLPQSCSPYVIGPVPFQAFQPDDPMLVGTVEIDESDIPGSN